MPPLNYKEIKPDGFLSHFVQCFWYYDTSETPVHHTILPDGYFDLIAEFENGVLTTVKRTGVWTVPIDIEIPAHTTFFGIRFKLLAAEYLFQNTLQSILDTTEPLPFPFWNMNVYKHHEFEKFVSATTAHLNHSVKHLNAIDSRKLKLFDGIYHQQIKTVSGLSSHVFWSSRQMNRYFNTQFGFPLKTFLKIVRCQSAYKAISNGSLGPQADYFDQAHFIKEVKKYTGATPKELHKNKNGRFLQLSGLAYK
ncbi:MAG: AraC family transcriptional regulator [Sediminibacterium sp.]|nr:AraC family transcriptional regulator [Sediminibacterium sp.]